MLNTGVNIQASKLDLATSYVAQLQHCAVICAIMSITTTPHHRLKHKINMSPYKSHSSLHL